VGKETMRVCDWIAEYLYGIGVTRVHGLMGGGASGLNDGFIKQGKIDYVCYHHEQGAGHAAIGESKFTGQLAVVNPTTGCAGTNCATSVLNAWQDSVPVLFLSGNVRLSTCSGWINEQHGIRIRKYGIQEHHVVDTYRSMTKYAGFVTKAEDVAYMLSRAIYLSFTGRPGPVWIDIPGDIQTAPMPENIRLFIPPEHPQRITNFDLVKEKLAESQRPLVLAGYGIRQANCVESFKLFVEKYGIPYVSTYGSRDYTADAHPCSIGAVGIKGSRAGNFAMQNADLLLVLGSSLGASVIGYDPKQFSPASYKIVVDCDRDELTKRIVGVDHAICADLEDFFGAML
jgi:acetolactate synthase-1/2/3 large subunit